MIESQAHLDPRFKNFPNLPEDEYESILAVPILLRDETLEGALNVRTREPRAVHEDEIDLLLAIAAQVAQSIEHAKLYAEAQRRVHELEALARISEAVSESLYLEESLEAIVKTTMDASRRPARRSCSRTAGSRGPRVGRHARDPPAASLARPTDRRARRRPRDAVHGADRELLASIATHAAVALEHGRAVMRGVLAQEIHHRVKNNLQTVASLLRLQARAPTTIDPREALEHSVNRILAIAAVHELLTEQRDEDVELADLIDRLRAMLVQGVGGGKEVRPSSSRSRLRAPRDRARARLLGAARRTRSSTAASTSASSSRSETATSCSRSPTTAPGSRTTPPKGRASRSSGRSSATSCAGRSSSTAAPARGAGPSSRLSGHIDHLQLVREMRILIAEDETIIRLDLRDLLERAGYEVVAEARDGEEAVALAREHEPELAVMDVKMPKLDGIEAAEDPRGAPDPDRDAHCVRPGRARRPRGRGGRLRLSREAVPRAGPRAGDRDRPRAPRGARRRARGGRVARRGARRPQGDRAREGAADGEGEALGARRVRAAAQGEPGLGPAAEGDRRGRDRYARAA